MHQFTRCISEFLKISLSSCVKKLKRTILYEALQNAFYKHTSHKNMQIPV